jgi:hydroxyethylthiazole kinase-like uncharacterized protein yjeF
MSIILTTAQMKQLDRRTIHDFGIPSRILMENAGKGCVDYLREVFDSDLALGTIVLCGQGNNGGDGYVIARWLDCYGYAVNIISIGEGEMSPEAKANKELCEKLGINFVIPSQTDYEVFSNFGVIIDALYGIGLRGNLSPEVGELIHKVNKMQSLKVAIDVPSGLNADTGYAEVAFQADITLTLDSFKTGHFLGRGRQYCGIVETIPIGIPAILKNNLETATLIDDSNASLPERSPFANKGDLGRIAVFAGSPGFTGAAFLSSRAAVKSGAGLVTIYCHPSKINNYNGKPDEVMVKTVPFKEDGTVDFVGLDTQLGNTDVILFGPGCGISDYTYQILEYLADKWQKQAVIDADGLNVLAKHPELIGKLSGKPIILTPHWGEFCRLADIKMDEMHLDSLGCLKQFVEKYNLKVLLKSFTSIYYDTEKLLFNISGNDGLATGGSGDILSGIIAGFLGQKMPIAKAAINAAFYLGITAEILAETMETLTIIPSDILSNLFRYDLLDNEPDEQN